MTLLAGIICKDGIVVASDSQTTWGSGKSWDANKMNELSLPYGRALVAESGAILTSQKIVEHLEELVKNRDQYDKHGLPELAAQAVKKVRDHLRHQQFECSSEEFQDYIRREELECELMIVGYNGDAPKIYTITLSQGLARESKHYFDAVGSGSDLATYLLSDLSSPGIEVRSALIIAAHVVEIAKRHDPYCGGPTKLGVLRLPEQRPLPIPGQPTMPFETLRMFYAPPIVLAASEVEEIVQMVLEVDAETKKNRGDIIREALQRRSQRRLKEIMDSYPDDFYPRIEGYE